jgi:hypothetical protein
MNPDNSLYRLVYRKKEREADPSLLENVTDKAYKERKKERKLLRTMSCVS